MHADRKPDGGRVYLALHGGMKLINMLLLNEALW